MLLGRCQIVFILGDIDQCGIGLQQVLRPVGDHFVVLDGECLAHLSRESYVAVFQLDELRDRGAVSVCAAPHDGAVWRDAEADVWIIDEGDDLQRVFSEGEDGGVGAFVSQEDFRQTVFVQVGGDEEGRGVLLVVERLLA